MALIDLHIHSDKSDGEYSPGDVVRLAADAGLRVMALTDHDTTGGIDEALEAASRISGAARDGAAGEAAAFRCIPGIEITTAHAREQHILGYLIQYGKPSFRDFTKRLSSLRRERAYNILEYLNKRGVPLSYEQVRRSSAGGANDYIGRPQIAREMMRRGYAASVKEVFDEYFTGEGFRAVPRPKPSAEESIGEIRAAGGVAVLAHPYSTGLRGPELAARLKALKAQGLEGVECHYGVYARADTRDCVRMADSLGLIVTGGSDFHGPHIKPGVRIATGRDGMLDFDDRSAVERLEAAARERS
ncbi:MAG: PHP domain-containing protein [Clostridiales Family XIII bacterium]|jgi:predicted metal-dependent phosphoesterase TrpH|nr:PHP domain-containing protein [Clostridiales Family XIII bacterium]